MALCTAYNALESCIHTCLISCAVVWDRSCSETSIERCLPITQVRALCTLPVVCFVGTNFAEEVACGVISMLEDSLSLSLPLMVIPIQNFGGCLSMEKGIGNGLVSICGLFCYNKDPSNPSLITHAECLVT